jgi:type I restriction enzyme S subunit
MVGSYVDALVRMPHFAQEVNRYSKGVWSSRLRLYPEGFFEVWFPVPPLEEQRAIVAHISAETAKLDGLRAATERTIALLKERRAALIAAAVTGKVDVKLNGITITS